MLRKSDYNALITAGVLLLLAAFPSFGQGVLRQEYSGLDKYPVQGRAENSSFVGVRAAEFLEIPVGARGIALGGACSAITDDITSIWWNPAGLGFLDKSEVMVNVVDYTMDLVYTYAAGAVPIADGRMTVGAFFGYLDIPETEVTTINSPNGTGRTYNAYDYQMGGTFACNFSDRFIGGISMKYIHQEVFGNIAGNAFAIDAGAIYHTDLMDREIRFAFAIQNLGTNITMRGPNLLYEIGPDPTATYMDYSTDPTASSRQANRWAYRQTHTYRLPTTVKLALAYNLLTSEKANWLASGEIWRNSSYPISYAAGTEVNYSFHQFLSGSLRLGWLIQSDEFTDANDSYGYEYWGDDPTFRGLSFGGGIKRDFGGRAFQFSYAYRNKGRLSADNFFTFTFGF